MLGLVKRSQGKGLMHIHVLGICGTFMGGIAALAQQLGHRVTGSDRNVYPPMSTQLEALGIELSNDDDLSQLEPAPDLVIIGNALSRGHALVEEVLARRLPYISGPQWLGEQILRHKHVLAVAGTHGKTTTASMLVWILEQAHKSPSFLVGGVVQPFAQTARLTESDYFVVEADEYDTAFFDKRSKFLHYFADTLVLNNLEFDHADIFADLAAIQKQFGFLLRTVPRDGTVITPRTEQALTEVLAGGCWSQQVALESILKPNQARQNKGWEVALEDAAGQRFSVYHDGVLQGSVDWELIGTHNVANATMAMLAAVQIGVPARDALSALNSFTAPARRLQLKGIVAGVSVYDDFAHHPTAIATTLQAMRARFGDNARIIAVFEPRSNTMKAGVHEHTLAAAFAEADAVYALNASQQWDLQGQLSQGHSHAVVRQTVTDLANSVLQRPAADEHWVVMSNGGFGGIHQLLLDGLHARSEAEA